MLNRDMKKNRVYLDYYELSEAPFAITPDPQFLFHSNTHRNVIDKILYGIHSKMGFILLFGEVGTGKTTICRTILDRLDGVCKTVYIINPSISGRELISAILDDLGIEYHRDATKKERIDRLNDFLLSGFGEQTVVIVVDDAQTMPVDTLEDLRLLSNLETDKRKLLQMVLVGQPELVEKLSSPALRQLMQRVSISCRLEYLERNEVEGYILRRLFISGEKGRIRFTRNAIKAIFRASLGNPRLINKICDYALTAGYISNAYRIRADHVRKALEELGPIALVSKTQLWTGADAPVGVARGWRHRLSLAAALAMGLLLGIAGYQYVELNGIAPSRLAVTQDTGSTGQLREGVARQTDSSEISQDVKPASTNLKSSSPFPRTLKKGMDETVVGVLEKEIETNQPVQIITQTTHSDRKNGPMEDNKARKHQVLPMPSIPAPPATTDPKVAEVAHGNPQLQQEEVKASESEPVGTNDNGDSTLTLSPPHPLSVQPDGGLKSGGNMAASRSGERRPVALMLGSYKSMADTLRAVLFFKNRVTDVQWNPVDLGEEGIWYRVFTGDFKSTREAFEYKAQHGLTESLIVTMPWTVCVGPADSMERVQAIAEKLESNQISSYSLTTDNGEYTLTLGIFVTRKGAEFLADNVDHLDVGPVSVVLR